VILYDPIQVHQFAVDVVHNFDFRRWPHEKQRGATREHFDVAGMKWELRNKTVCETTLAADPGNDWCCHM
jgi:hypothetical protein